MKPKCKIVLRTSAASALTPATQGRAKTMIYANIQVVAAAVGGGDEVEILIIARQVWHRNIRQQSGGYGIDLRNRIIRELCAGGGIENLHWLPDIRARGVQSLGKIPLAFEQSRHRRKLIEGILTALSVVIHKKESLVSAVVDLGNIQRPADGSAKAVLFISGFDFGLSCQ